MSFHDHPFRRNAFDAFPLNKAETGRREIRRALQKGRDDWATNGGRVHARDGTVWELDEGHLNQLESVLNDPVERLKIEQLVHQQHPFTADAEVARFVVESVAQLAASAGPAALLDGLGAALRGRLTRFLPELPAPVLTDDLPWPAAPEPLPLALEPLDQAMLRDR